MDDDSQGALRQKVLQDGLWQVKASNPLGRFLEIGVVASAFSSRRHNAVRSRDHKLILIDGSWGRREDLVLPELREGKEVDIVLLDLGGASVGAVCCSLRREGRITHTHVESEACWHITVVMQGSHIHGRKEGPELDVVLNELILQFPGGQERI